MKPFILKYGIKISKDNTTAFYLYSKEHDINLIDSRFSFNTTNQTILSSGSFMTKADGDPTRDESTDR